MITDITESQETKPQSNDVVLSVQGVSKKFCRSLKRSLFYGIQDIAAELVGVRSKSQHLRTKEFWALKDVSFQLRRGESLGLVGPNGSGKTTLLRIISGLIKPDAGSVTIKGRVAPLIALGAGFNPILTGRENIYVNMSILGLSEKEIGDRFDAVVEFAEIGDAIDAPVQSYSSGMAARLGFASAIYTEPEILLIDEVLAVGDIKFRAKCYRKLAQLRENATSFILVSHSSQSILSICESGIYLQKGKLILSGNPGSVMDKYQADLFQIDEQNFSRSIMKLPVKYAAQSLGLDIISLYFKDNHNVIIDHPISGQPARLCIECQVHRKINNLNCSMLIREFPEEGDCIQNFNNVKEQQFLKVLPGKVEIQIQMPYCGFKPGLYTMKLSISENYFHMFDAVESFRFNVKGDHKMVNCSFYQPRKWIILNNQE